LRCRGALLLALPQPAPDRFQPRVVPESRNGLDVQVFPYGKSVHDATYCLASRSRSVCYAGAEGEGHWRPLLKATVSRGGLAARRPLSPPMGPSPAPVRAPSCWWLLSTIVFVHGSGFARRPTPSDCRWPTCSVFTYPTPTVASWRRALQLGDA